MTWEIFYTKQAQKDTKKISQSGLKKNVETLLALIQKDPYQNPPRFKKLIGDLDGLISRRINIQHRLIYEVNDSEQYIKILRMWSHYSDN